MSLKANKSDWVAMLSMMTVIEKEVTIKTDGVTAQCMAVDPAHAMFAKCIMNCEGEQDSFTVNSEQFLKGLVASGGDVQTINIDRDKGSIQIVGESKVRVPLYDEGEACPDIFEKFKEFECNGQFKASTLEPLVNYGIYKKQDYLKYYFKDGKLKIVVGEGANESECSFDDATGEGVVGFPLDYTMTMLKQSKGMDIKIGLIKSDSPARFQWEAGHSLSINVMLAPRIEEE